ncbi:winged helix-turn-helix domain-containing protein [Dietzia natronolimnaea]|uniref:winged helix-turn-helix domain-containing protein n=1 Tax=Dietzia natronolimnaea TaxID=161920 RepID=UPI003D1471CA
MTGPQGEAPAAPAAPAADAPDAAAPAHDGAAPDAGTRPDGHARHRLDEVIHAPVRFSIVAALAGVDDAEFATIRDAVEVSDSTLSKQVAVLEKAGYVKVRKGYVGKRPRTWLALSREGRRAYGSHLEALRAIAGG